MRRVQCFSFACVRRRARQCVCTFCGKHFPTDSNEEQQQQQQSGRTIAVNGTNHHRRSADRKWMAKVWAGKNAAEKCETAESFDYARRTKQRANNFLWHRSPSYSRIHTIVCSKPHTHTRADTSAIFAMLALCWCCFIVVAAISMFVHIADRRAMSFGADTININIVHGISIPLTTIRWILAFSLHVPFGWPCDCVCASDGSHYNETATAIFPHSLYVSMYTLF